MMTKTDPQHVSLTCITCLVNPLLGLPFVKSLPPVEQFPSLPHYRMTLRYVALEQSINSRVSNSGFSIDKEIKASTVRTAFGPVIRTLTKHHQQQDTESKAIKSVPGHRRTGYPAQHPTQDDGTDPMNQLPPNGSPLLGYQLPSLPAPIEPSPKPEHFKNSAFEIRLSSTAGYGAFSLINLSRGQTILIEKALFHANDVSLFDELEKLNPCLRQAFDRMYGHNAKPVNESLVDRAAIFRTNR